jgi:hypothetical protein
VDLSASMEIGIVILVIISLLFIIGSGSMVMSLIFDKDGSVIYHQPKIIASKPATYLTDLPEQDDFLELVEGLSDD